MIAKGNNLNLMGGKRGSPAQNALLGLSGLALVALLGFGLVARPYVDPATSRYPGSVEVGEQKSTFYSPDSQAIVRHGTYLTADELTPVRAWYAQHLQALASDSAEPTASNCAWLHRLKQVAIFHYSATVLVCTVPAGTTISLEERVSLQP
jgi:hypothetical protein